MPDDTAHLLESDLRQQPDDDARWLVYADWLTQRGDPRGQAIGLDQRRRQVGPAEAAQLQEQIDAQLTPMQAQIQAELAAALPEGELPEGARLSWRHGFIVGLDHPLSLDALESLGAILQHPHGTLLSRLRLAFPEDGDEDDQDGEDDQDNPLWSRPKPPELIEGLTDLALDRITDLGIVYTALPTISFTRLAQCAALGRLTALDLRYTGLDDDGLEVLAASPHLAGVTRLSLQRNRIGGRGVQALVRGRWSRLRELDLRDNRIGPVGARALAEAPQLAGLERLRLYHKDIGRDDDGLEVLARSPHLPSSIRRAWAARWSSHAPRVSEST